MKIINPYKGIDFKNALKVNSITHEHIYSEEQWKSAYERGIRHFGALHYSPACPRFPASNYAYKLQNGTPVLNTYKDFKDIANADYTIVDTELKGSVDSFTSNGKQKVESKQDMKDRGMNSPDEADCVLLVCLPVKFKKGGGKTDGK